MNDCCYFGRGRVYFTQPLTANGGVSNIAYGGRAGTNWPAAATPLASLRMPPGRFIGNAKGLEITPRLQPLDVPDFADLDGDPYIVQEVGIGLTMLRAGGANIADALSGTRSAAHGQQVTETIAASQAGVLTGDMIYVRHAIDLSKPVTVQPSWTNWATGVDFEPEAYGVRMLHGYSGPFNATIDITYTKEGGAEEIDGLSIKSRHVGIVYIGVNLMNGRPARVDCYRASLQPSDKYAPISEQVNEQQLSGVLKAVRSTGQARPHWFRIMNGASNA